MNESVESKLIRQITKSERPKQNRSVSDWCLTSYCAAVQAAINSWFIMAINVIAAATTVYHTLHSFVVKIAKPHERFYCEKRQ